MERNHFRHYQAGINCGTGHWAMSEGSPILLMAFLIDNIAMTLKEVKLKSWEAWEIAELLNSVLTKEFNWIASYLWLAFYISVVSVDFKWKAWSQALVVIFPTQKKNWSKIVIKFFKKSWNEVHQHLAFRFEAFVMWKAYIFPYLHIYFFNDSQ